MDRDPRITPKVGDEIKQGNQGCHLKVTKIDDERIEWQRKVRHGWVFDNAWTIKAWQKIVANNAIVIHVAA